MGNPPVSGSLVQAAVIDGTIGKTTIQGAARGITTFTSPGHSSTTGTQFAPLGSVRAISTNTATPRPQGGATITGSGTITGGTGAYKGATGSFTSSGTAQPGGGTTQTLTGSIRY